MQPQSPKNKHVEEDDDDDHHSELDFYQLSDVDTSNLLSSSIKKP